MQTIKQKIKSFIPQITKHAVYSTIAVLVGITSVYAIGTLTPTGTPGDDTQYSLNDIFDKLTDFTDSATEGSGAMVVPGTVSATFRTLSEIYGLLEAEEADLVPENIVDGVEIFGVVGTKEDVITYPTEWSEYSPTSLSMQEGIEYCSYLENDGVTVSESVQNIWRLPNYMELSNAYITSVPGFVVGRHWSSNLFPGSTVAGYFFYVGFGNSTSTNILNAYLIRCVR